MTSHIETPSMAHARPIDRAWTRALVPIGRVLFAAIFIMSSFGHITGKATEHAVAAGVPMASVLVPLSGIIALAGGAMVALGFHARIGALLLIIFLVPVTLMMHAFWNVTDPQQHQMQMINFMKNVSMLGGALFMAYFGSGPFSVDSKQHRG